jgi:hypothetical protein
MAKQLAKDNHTKEEIRKLIVEMGQKHHSHPAVLAFLIELARLDPINYRGLITHCLKYCDHIHMLCQSARNKLVEILGPAGFSFMSNLTEFSTFATLFNYDEDDCIYGHGDYDIHNYVTLRCKFVFVNKKTFEQLELMTSFSAGKTKEIHDMGSDHIYSWADKTLMLPTESMGVYTLNKMLVRPECAPKYLRIILQEIIDMFQIETRRDRYR